MEEQDIKQLWQAYDAQLQAALRVNETTLRELQTLKAKRAVRGMLWVKWLGIIVGIIWIAVVYTWVSIALAVHNYFFAASAGVHLVVTTAMVVTYLRHLGMLHRIDRAASVIAVQEGLARLQASTLDVTRIGFLQLPVFATFMLGWGVYKSWQVMICIAVAILFTLAALWLYANISLKNADKRWFRLLFSSPEWTQIVRAKTFLAAIENYKGEEA